MSIGMPLDCEDTVKNAKVLLELGLARGKKKNQKGFSHVHQREKAGKM